MAAQSTYTLIATVTANGTNSNMNFLNIPQTYTDLVLIVNANSTATQAGNILLDYAVGGTYSATYLSGNGSAASSFRLTALGAGAMLAGGSNFTTSSNPISMVIHFLNYANTTTYKTYISRIAGDQNGSGYVQEMVGLWQKTNNIYEILLSTGSGSIYWTGTASLYGITAA
jgi:hypothetical protein